MSIAMKLQYRDRWPTPDEVAALGPDVRWMQREWRDQWSVSEIVSIKGESFLLMSGGDWEEWQHEDPDCPISLAPIDRDGNAVEWPKPQVEKT